MNQVVHILHCIRSFAWALQLGDGYTQLLGNTMLKILATAQTCLALSASICLGREEPCFLKAIELAAHLLPPDCMQNAVDLM